MANKSKRSDKKVSRNKKRYWRKGTSIKDVEKFVDNVREDERFGLPTKSDSEIFFFHKSADDVTGQKKLLERVEWRCYQNLKPNSAVPAFKEQKVGARKTIRKEQRKLDRICKKLPLLQTTSNQHREADFYGLWDEKAKPSIPLLSPDVELGYLRFTKQVLPKVPQSVKKKVTNLPNIELPNPGQSYNPDEQDYKHLLEQAAAVELKKIEEERKLHEKLRPKAEVATEASKFAEACEGLEMFTRDKQIISDSEDDETDVKPDLDRLKAILSKKPIDGEQRKTMKTRRREKVAELTKQQKMAEKMNKKRLNEVFRLKSLKREIEARQDQSNKRTERRKKLAEEKLLGPFKMGKTRYEEPDVDMLLPSEISGSLRLLKPQGNIMEDRYKSLLKRNVVEPRRLQLSRKRKYAMKKYEKRGCEDVTTDYNPR